MATNFPALSFDRAHRVGDPPPPDACVFCHRGIEREYFRVNGHMACVTCAHQAETLVPPDSHTAFSRALLFGLGAAIVGCIGYALFEILTGWIMGWIALLVGQFVGRAMKSGSRGLGGPRYQLTAALLTYAAVAVAFVPVALHEAAKSQAKSRHAHTVAAQRAEAEHPFPGDQANSNPQPNPTQQAAPAPAAHARPGLGVFLVAVVKLLGLGLVSPLLMFMDSVPMALLNLFIILIGVQMAWKLTASPRAAVEGPFMSSPPPLVAS